MYNFDIYNGPREDLLARGGQFERDARIIQANDLANAVEKIIKQPWNVVEGQLMFVVCQETGIGALFRVRTSEVRFEEVTE